MANILKKIGEGIFNINFWWHYERPIRKSMKRADAYFDEAVETLNRAIEDEPVSGSIGDVFEIENTFHEAEPQDGICTTMEHFQACVAKGKEEMILVDEAYKLWKPFVRAATKRTLTQTINVKGDWNVTFGHGENMVILSTPYKGKNTIGVYRVELNSIEKNIIFKRVK